jgi:hypothetical protein
MTETIIDDNDEGDKEDNSKPANTDVEEDVDVKVSQDHF